MFDGNFIKGVLKVLLCLKDKCYYYVKSDDLELCDLVLDEALSGDSCIGYEQIEKEMDSVMRDIEYASKRYRKLQKLKARINKYA